MTNQTRRRFSMVYIAKQKVYGKEYYYLRKSKRVGDKVKSVCLG